MPSPRPRRGRCARRAAAPSALALHAAPACRAGKQGSALPAPACTSAHPSRLRTCVLPTGTPTSTPTTSPTCWPPSRALTMTSGLMARSFTRTPWRQVGWCGWGGGGVGGPMAVAKAHGKLCAAMRVGYARHARRLPHRPSAPAAVACVARLLQRQPQRARLVHPHPRLGAALHLHLHLHQHLLVPLPSRGLDAYHPHLFHPCRTPRSLPTVLSTATAPTTRAARSPSTARSSCPASSRWR